MLFSFLSTKLELPNECPRDVISAQVINSYLGARCGSRHAGIVVRRGASIVICPPAQATGRSGVLSVAESASYAEGKHIHRSHCLQILLLMEKCFRRIPKCTNGYNSSRIWIYRLMCFGK